MLDKAELSALATLAKLESPLPEFSQELEALAPDLEKMDVFFQQILDCPCESGEPAPDFTTLRPDEPVPSLSQTEALNGIGQEGYFVIGEKKPGEEKEGKT